MALLPLCEGTVSQDANNNPVCNGTWTFYDIDPLTVTDLRTFSDLHDLLSSIFATPTVAEIQVAMGAGFTLPLLAYMVAWGYGLAINFMSKD